MPYEWSPPIEDIIKKIGEQSQCFSILHRRSERYYAYFNHFIAIPVIVLSTISGSGNFIFGGDKDASMAVGALSILIGIIQTLGTYFRFAQLSEANRISAIQYNKLYQKISTELALTREHRMDANLLLSDIRETTERLEEISPVIPLSVIETFKKDYAQYKDISRPNIANGLENIKINVEPPTLPRSTIPSLSFVLPPVPPSSPVNNVIVEISEPEKLPEKPPKSKHWK
jgi:hypothetical protein